MSYNDDAKYVGNTSHARRSSQEIKKTRKKKIKMSKLCKVFIFYKYEDSSFTAHR